MIEVFDNPLLLDFIRVAIELPEDERRQLEEFSGEQFTIDGCAIGNFTVPGPKWVVKRDGVPLVVGGFSPLRPGVWQDFLLTTKEAWEPANAFRVTLACRRVMDAMFKSGQAHRIQCVVPESRVSSRPELEKWYKVLGYKKEATLHGYCANGYAAAVYSRVGR